MNNQKLSVFWLTNTILCCLLAFVINGSTLNLISGRIQLTPILVVLGCLIALICLGVFFVWKTISSQKQAIDNRLNIQPDDTLEALKRKMTEYGVEYVGQSDLEDNLNHFIGGIEKNHLAYNEEKLSAAHTQFQQDIQNKITQSEQLNAEIAKLKAETDALRSKTFDSLNDSEIMNLIDQISEADGGAGMNQERATSLVSYLLKKFPDVAPKIKSLAYISEEEKRIDQYDATMRLYAKKIRAAQEDTELDEESRDTIIAHLKELRDNEMQGHSRVMSGAT